MSQRLSRTISRRGALETRASHVEPHRLRMASAPTILIVEDHVDMRGAVVVMLEREGFHVEEADNGAEAMTYVRSGAPVSAIILDLAMPVVSGWDFLAACR